jgi:ATP-binding cassette subfamily B protein
MNTNHTPIVALPKKLFAFLWHFIKMQPVAFIIIFVTAIVWSVNEVFFPYFLKLIVNTLQDYHGDPHLIFHHLLIPIAALMVIWLVMELSMRIQGIILIYTFPRFRSNIRAAVFNYVKQHSHEYFSNNFAGSIAKKIAELPTSAQTIMEIICFNFTSIMAAFVIALIMMWVTKPIFAGILLLWFILHFAATFLYLRLGDLQWQVHSEASSTLSGKIVDSLTNINNVKLFARSGYESDYLQLFQHDEIKKAKKAMWTVEKMRLLQGMLGFLLIMTMVLLLIRGWSQGWVSLGDFSLIGVLSFWMLGMIWYMSYQMTTFIREVGTMNEGLTLIAQTHDIVDAPDAKSLLVPQGKIEFQQVSFAYRNQYIFQNFNVTIEPGQKVGLVGFSGAGKSTFVNLILRLYDIQSGKITIDGQENSKVTQSSLHSEIAIIPQDPMLFHRTLMENIRYGRLEASDDEVIEASKLAHCHEFITQLPESYEALVGERGVKLSGGQRQRIAIARAILKNAPILILDEATSSLDSVTEKLIHESLEHLMKNRTTIVVAHRLSTLGNMDRILVFQQGKIIEDGTHQELLKTKGHFAMLWNMQSEGFLPEHDEETK